MIFKGIILVEDNTPERLRKIKRGICKDNIEQYYFATEELTSIFNIKDIKIIKIIKCSIVINKK